MKLSIVIPTFNGQNKIHNLLKSLNLQTFKDFDVIISIDGSEDETKNKVFSIRPEFAFDILVLDNPHGGRAKCRNAGAKAAQGDILIFYDDDVRINPKSVETHYLHHLKTPASICTGPAYYEETKLTTDFQKFRAQMEHSWYPTKNNKKLTAGMPGANWSIKKKDFFKIGMLNESLTDSEDFEFSYRATHKFNIPIFFNIDTWVYHDDYKSFYQYLQRYILGNQSLLNLFDVNDEIRKDYWKKLYIKRSPMKTLFFSLFNNDFLVKFTESNLFLTLPEKARYTIYDYIITSQTRYFLNENFNSYKKI